MNGDLKMDNTKKPCEPAVSQPSIQVSLKANSLLHQLMGYCESANHILKTDKGAGVVVNRAWLVELVKLTKRFSEEFMSKDAGCVHDKVDRWVGDDRNALHYKMGTPICPFCNPAQATPKCEHDAEGVWIDNIESAKQDRCIGLSKEFERTCPFCPAVSGCEPKLIDKRFLEAEQRASQIMFDRTIELIDNAIKHELEMSGGLESASEMLKHEHAVVVLKRLRGAIIP